MLFGTFSGIRSILINIVLNSVGTKELGSSGARDTGEYGCEYPSTALPWNSSLTRCVLMTNNVILLGYESQRTSTLRLAEMVPRGLA